MFHPKLATSLLYLVTPAFYVVDCVLYWISEYNSFPIRSGVVVGKLLENADTASHPVYVRPSIGATLHLGWVRFSARIRVRHSRGSIPPI